MENPKKDAAGLGVISIVWIGLILGKAFGIPAMAAWPWLAVLLFPFLVVISLLSVVLAFFAISLLVTTVSAAIVGLFIYLGEHISKSRDK